MKKLSIILTLAIMLASTTGCKDDSSAKDELQLDVQYYEYLAAAILNFQNDQWNQNYAGRTTGRKNDEFDGAYGGKIKVTGQIEAPNDFTAVDLEYTLTDVKYIWYSENTSVVVTIVMNGTFKYKGTFNESYNNTVLTSSELSMSGTMKRNSSVKDIEESGEIALTAKEKSVSGVIFGKTVSWSSKN